MNSGDQKRDGDCIEDMPATIIGKGRIGLALHAMGGLNDVLVGRGDSIMSDGTGPIYVCTRNDALEDVIQRCPDHRKEDLVFLQNGMIDPFLQEKGLSENAQALLYFAVATKGATPIDGVTELNPEGLTAATGKWAKAFSARLAKGGLKCNVLNGLAYKQKMLEKLIFICAFNLIGVKHRVTLGEVASTHAEEVEPLIEELAAAAADDYNLTFEEGITDRLKAYALSVADYPTAIKETEWRNGYFLALSSSATAKGQIDPCQYHTELWGQLT